MSKHTPGRMFIEEFRGSKVHDRTTSYVLHSDWEDDDHTPDNTIGEIYGPQDFESAEEETRANANRLIACWNALDGVDDPEAWVREAKSLKEAARNWADIIQALVSAPVALVSVEFEKGDRSAHDPVMKSIPQDEANRLWMELVDACDNLEGILDRGRPLPNHGSGGGGDNLPLKVTR